MSTTPPPDAAPLLDVRDLEVHFPIRRGILKRTVGHVRAVDGVNLSIRRGEVVGLVGESGSGKTTLGRAVLRLIPPTGGRILFDGTDLTTLDDAALVAFRRRMQVVFQDPYASLNPRMSVGDIVAEGLTLHGLATDADARRQRVGDLLEMVGLPRGAARRYPHEFSGGQRQRIGIARALAVEPELVVADEPVSALDVSVQAQVLNLIGDIQEAQSLAILFIGHDLSVIEYLCDRVVVMYLGRVMETAPAAQLYDRPMHPYTKALLDAAPGVPGSAARRRDGERTLLQGDLPSPAAPPSGCVFRTRCPMAIAACAEVVPELTPTGEGAAAACIRL